MTQEEILEGNKLIAEFLGKEFVHWTFENRTQWISGRSQQGESFQCFSDYINLPYNKSWAWLMPVVEKIESLEIYTLIDKKINGDNYVIFADWESNAWREIGYIKSNHSSKIQAVYNVVIQFIKWYNNQNNE